MMTHRAQTHIVPFPADHMFQLVADVERYPEFVPYCTGLRVLNRRMDGAKDVITAEMLVQYKVFRERFKCEVRLDRASKHIDVHYIEGPIRKLDNAWQFTDLDNGQSEIRFEIEFAFKNFLMQKLSNAVFDKAFTYMSDAFVGRAHEVYGNSGSLQTPVASAAE